MKAACLAFGRLCLIFLTLTTAANAQRNLKNIPDPDPELERKALQVAEGFEINLFAADPKLAKPIQMNFDPQGRLWIASSSIYPHIKPGEVANDKVLVLEDTNGDGTSDKTTVFADGLLIPTGIEPGDGGVYVANSTELLHFADTNGDGKADRTRVVLSGFGTEDTHHILHTLRWGPEGLLYFNQSIYIHSHLETPYGVRRLNAGGIWQLQPETLKLNVYARGWVNTWGHHFDDWGQSFVTDGAGGQGINYCVPGAYYQTAYGASRLLPGLNPGSPKYCGLEVTSGRHLPDDWQGSLLTNDFRGHRVCRFVLTEEGTGYVSRQQPELVKTNHVAFRPIDIKMGPDGAIYIADWYNPIIQHGEVDFRDPRRDHTHGRIWRITAKGRPLVKRPQLVGQPIAKLVESLKVPEEWTRRNAKRVIKELCDGLPTSKSATAGVKRETQSATNVGTAIGPAPIVAALEAFLASLDPKDPRYEHHQLEALWTFQTIRVVRPALLQLLLTGKDHRVRAAATRIIGHWYDQLDQPMQLLAARVADEHPRVRLEAVRVLSNVPKAAAVEVALKALEQPVDKWLDYALWLTARESQQHWLPALQAGRLSFGGSAEQLTFAVKSIGSPTVVQPLMKLIHDGKVALERQAEVLSVIASIGGPNELEFVLEQALSKSIPPRDQASVLQAATQAARDRNVRTKNANDIARRLVSSEDAATRATGIRLSGIWKVSSQSAAIARLANDSKQPFPVRAAAIEAMPNVGGPSSQVALNKLASSRDARIQFAAIRTLVSLDPANSIDAAQQFLEAADESQADALFNVFLQSKAGPAALAKGLKGKQIPKDAAKVGLRAVSASGRKHPDLVAVLTKLSGIATVPKQLSAKEMAAMVDAVQSRGDAAIGERVFRRASLNCMKCHAIGGAGGRIGPDMISLGSSAQVDYIVDSMLIPSKAMKEGYQTVVVVTDRGKVHTGIKLRQSTSELFLRNIDDKEITIPLKSIDEQSNGTSMMPVGLTDKLTRDEFVHLVRFLSELGKVGGKSISKATLARRWRVMRDTADATFRLRRTSYDTAATNDPAYTWLPAYSTVAGDLPVIELPRLSVPGRQGKISFAKCDLDVSTAGAFELSIAKPDGLLMWIDANPTSPESNVRLTLKEGQHTLTFAVPESRTQSLRVELKSVSGVANFTTGK